MKKRAVRVYWPKRSHGPGLVRKKYGRRGIIIRETGIALLAGMVLLPMAAGGLAAEAAKMK